MVGQDESKKNMDQGVRDIHGQPVGNMMQTAEPCKSYTYEPGGVTMSQEQPCRMSQEKPGRAMRSMRETRGSMSPREARMNQLGGAWNHAGITRMNQLE